jgi:predicted Zn-dependent peptidase
MTQNDKMIDALTHFDEIINNMPASQAAFDIAKESLLASLRTERYTGRRVLDYWQRLQDLGFNEDIRKNVFEEVSKMTLDDVVAYQQKHIKDRTYSTCVLGNEAELDMERLAERGRIERLTTEQIFGY